MTSGMDMLEVWNLLGRLHDEAQTPAEKEKIDVAIDAISFILKSGQRYEFEGYRQSLEVNAPPLVTASFDSREEAMAWLNVHPHPPDGAHVLVAGEYHRVAWFQELSERRLPRGPVLPYYLAELARGGLPPPVATFDTYEQAKSWVDNQPEPPQQVFILIAGEYHLVAYHYRVDVRAIYPMSLAAKSQPEGEADG